MWWAQNFSSIYELMHLKEFLGNTKNKIPVQVTSKSFYQFETWLSKAAMNQFRLTNWQYLKFMSNFLPNSQNKPLFPKGLLSDGSRALRQCRQLWRSQKPHSLWNQSNALPPKGQRRWNARNHKAAKAKPTISDPTWQSQRRLRMRTQSVAKQSAWWTYV